MIYFELIVSLVLAIILTAIFSLAFKNVGPWNSFWIFFLLIFLVTFAASRWVGNIGPVLWGINLVPLILVGFIFAFMIAATTPFVRSKGLGHDDKEGEKEKGRGFFSIYFIGLLILLILVIILSFII